jgi:hypothetical protein
MNPVEQLRAAAQTLRTAAELAGSQTWTADCYPEGTIVRPANSTRSLFRLAANGTRAAGTPNVAAPIGEYIATMNPRVGIAVADWLDSAAKDAMQIGPDPHALAVARAIQEGRNG